MLCICLFLTMPNMVLGEDTDVDDYVRVLSERGIITGYEDGTFGLENEITRAEFSAIAVRMLQLEGLAKNSDYKTEFKDVAVGQWYTGYVNAATGKNLLKGYDDKTFRPNKKITLAEAVTITVRIVDGDVIYGHWPTNYLLRASELGIFEDVTMSEAMAPATRATVFRLIYNAMFHTTEDNKIKPAMVRGLVVSNDRVNGIEDGSIVIELLENLDRENMALERGIQFKYKLKATEDPEVFLGKVVDVDFLGEEIRSISIDPDYDYLTGKITNIRKNSFELDERKYSVEKKDLTGNTIKDTRLYEIYVDGDSVDYSEFEDFKELEFAKVTVLNGKVLFVDALNIENMGPIKEAKNESIRVRDNTRNALPDRVSYDDRDLLEFVKVGENVDLKRLTNKTFNPGEMAYYNDDFIVIDRSSKISGKLDKIKSSAKEVVVNGVNYELNFEDEPIGNTIFSGNLVDYKVLDEDNFISEVRAADDKIVSLSLDIYGKVQLIEATPTQDNGIFALVYDLLGDKLWVKDSNNSERKYVIDTGAEFGRIDLKDLYDDKAIEDIPGYQNIQIRELKNAIKDVKKDALVYMTLENNVVTRIILIDMDDAWFKTTEMEKKYIEIEDAIDDDYYEFDEYKLENTKVLVLGSKMQVMTPTNFLNRYAVSEKYPLDSALVTFKDFDSRVKYLFTKPAGNDAGAKTKEIVRKIVDVELSETADYIELEDMEGTIVKHKVVSPRVSKMLDEEQIEEGDVIKANVLYNTARDVVKIKLLAEENTAYVYKVLDITSKDISLGFDMSVDTDIDKFKENNRFEVKLASKLFKFGDIDEKDFVVVHYDEDQNIDTILKVDEPDELAQGGKTYFAEVSVVDKGIIDLKGILVIHAPIGKYFRVENSSAILEFNEKEQFMKYKGEDSVKVFILDEDKEEIGEIEVSIDKDSEKSYPIELYD